MDEKALGILGGLVEKCHLHTVTASTSALELWNSLKATYACQSIANQLQLGCQLHNLMKGKDETIYESRPLPWRWNLPHSGRPAKGVRALCR